MTETNKYCALSSLKNESDVEQFFLLPLLAELGYASSYLETKATIEQVTIGKGKYKKFYIPDYIGYINGDKPVLVVDAKHPDKSADEGVDDAQMYASVLRRKLHKPKPDQYCMGSNGLWTIIKHYDSNEVLHKLAFSDFTDNSSKFIALKADISRGARTINDKNTQEPFSFTKPPIPALIAIFEACHNLIWRKEKIPPAEAFYEFAKLLFVKLKKDREIHEKMEKNPVSTNDYEFSVRWIERLESAAINPINTILFARLRDDLEDEIQTGTKKRMFDKGENIKLNPTTIKEVVRLLEHQDLYSIDEDLNGRMFETFLTAVIRGRSLGQFFTPRTVVKFMVDMAGLSITKKIIPRVLDACCGTGGFLIEAMARLTDRVKNNSSLSGSDKEQLMQTILRESLWGIEANETIARIARINMYLHQDGGSRIYRADSLDKQLAIEHELVGEAKRDFDELCDAILKQRIHFNIVLTNPPFAMRYEAKKKDEKRILQQYILAHMTKSSKLTASLRSSIMFVERYYDLLQDNGVLLTVIDDSVLNTTAYHLARNWIKERFVIRAIISLPRNCFVVAGSAAKTSIMVLQKKGKMKESQPAIFMAESKNVGHRDSGKPELEANDLPSILAEWNRFASNGTIPTKERCFIVPSEKIDDRLDVRWYDPEYLSVYKQLESVPYVRINDLQPSFKYGASIDADYKSDIPFLRIENIRPNDIDLSDLQSIPSAVYLKQIKSLFLKEGDILITRSGTVGLCVAIPKGFENFVYGSYMIRLRLKDQNQINLNFLSVYLNSRLGQMQFERLKTGSLQFNINIQQLRDIIIPQIPLQHQEEIVKKYEIIHSKIKETRQEIKFMEADLADSLTANITSSAGIKSKLVLPGF